MLDKLVELILQSPKYRHVSPDFIARIGAEEMHRQAHFKAAVKATKNKLHQTASAYLKANINYAHQLAAIQHAEDTAAQKAACLQTMRLHASTAERIPILEEFYQVTLAPLTPLTSILDIACGLNPLAAPWMPLAPNALYFAYDIFQDMTAFLTGALASLGLRGSAQVADIGAFIPPQEVDIALLLKALPCLEQSNKHVNLSLLAGLRARHLLISYPTRSLGGKQKGMVPTYDQHFASLVAGTGWDVQRFAFPSELVFLVTK